MTRIILAVSMALAAWAVPSLAVLPEPGLYWNPERSGLGYYIEVQGDNLVMLTFAYDPETQKPLFYLASGKVQPPEQSDDGRVQYYHFSGALVRFDAGPCLVCFWEHWDTSETAAVVGEIRLDFFAPNGVMLAVQMNDGTSATDTLQRMHFGIPSYEVEAIDYDVFPVRQYIDMRGTWAFVQDDGERLQSLAFNFTEVRGPAQFYGTLFGQVFEEGNWSHSTEAVWFKDPAANAELICIVSGCALQQGGKTLFLFHRVAFNIMDGFVPIFRDDYGYDSGALVSAVRVPQNEPRALSPSSGE